MKAEKGVVLLGAAPYLPKLARRLTSEQRRELRANKKGKKERRPIRSGPTVRRACMGVVT